MPWVETEELFRSTLKAAIDAAPPHDGIPKDPHVVDLGEAGRKEVWRSGTKTISKTIAKHGGKSMNLCRIWQCDAAPSTSVAQKQLDLRHVVVVHVRISKRRHCFERLARGFSTVVPTARSTRHSIALNLAFLCGHHLQRRATQPLRSMYEG